ncbi:ABC transporter substrate-binding protein [uncultured Roseivirga sp.]|uniref:ABC transporter substrate-binding protein n=1 Tax=uncultured Roseivirga sp. TaxID=543088 RepID=UPI0030D9FF66|tara:strand:- start:203932 stop:205125 length:1194 start_codon:yes stop_codon:yes gene_type:complete
MKKTEKRNAHRGAVYTLLCFLMVGFFACQSNSKNQSDFPDFDPKKDYFPEKVSIDHSIGFDIEYHNNYKTLHLFRHYNDVVDTVSFLLVQRGTPAPERVDLPVISIPVQKAVSLSTTHLGMFKILDAFDQLKGIERKQYVSNPTVIEMVDAGKIIEVEPSGTLNVETIIDMETEVVLGVGYPNSQNESFQQLQRLNIPVVLNADWQEIDLLGRAEWVKLLAVLLNKEALVNQKFAEIEEEFQSVLDLIAEKVKEAPLTITGIAQGDAWHVSGGKSFAYNMLKIARADYPWKDDNSTGSIKLSFETVYEIGLNADFWIAPGSARTLENIRERDPRYMDFKSYKNKTIYNVFGRNTEGGGNDYYETGVIEPHIVLKDVVKIFHPELLPDHQLVYYNQLK